MNTKNLLPALLLLFSTNAFSQTFDWATNIGSTANDGGRSIAVDGSGNVYTTGYFRETVDFDPGAGTYSLSAAGGEEIYIQKLDPTGNFIWAKRMGATGADVGWAIAVDVSGNVHTTGYFTGTVDFDPGAGTFNLSATGSADIFVQKLDASGNFLWAQKMGSLVSDAGYGIAIDGSGNVYTTGYFWGTVDFDPGAGTFNLTSAGGNDVFVQKLDPTGNFVWAKSMGSSSTSDMGHSITIDATNNVYTAGHFQGTADFDPGAGVFNLTADASFDVFVQKLDGSGNFIWAKSMGGGFSEIAYSIAVDGSGNCHVTGYFQGTADFDPGAGTFNLTSLGSNDIFVQKMDASGNFVWAKRMGSTANDYGYSITIDGFGNVYTIGYFQGTTDFDPAAGTFNLTSAGGFEVFIQKLDPAGAFTWAERVGSVANDNGNSITVDASGNIYTTGYFEGTVDFDPGAGIFNLTSFGTEDIFVSKWGQCVSTSSTISPVVCISYTVPSGDETYTGSGTYSDTIANAAGCDSVITINLTVNTVDITVAQLGLTLTANASGAIYQWVDCDAGYAILIGETGQVFTASSNGNYAVIVTEGGCVDTSACYGVTDVAINEQLNSNINIYPNPSSGSYIVNLGKSYSDISIAIKDVSGQIIALQKFSNLKEFEIEINGPSGVYFLEVITIEGYSSVLRIIKNND
ncbi:SBBP repeat-containing protein [Crocinitomix catalasitica]|nr:SBBP repeat-containing protein [Crocinitomix catalasitica]